MSDDETPHEPAVSSLFDAYYSLGEEICKRIGHDWQTIKPRSGEVTLPGSIDRCERCHETRTPPEYANSSTHTRSIDDVSGGDS